MSDSVKLKSVLMSKDVLNVVHCGVRVGMNINRFLCSSEIRKVVLLFISVLTVKRMSYDRDP